MSALCLLEPANFLQSRPTKLDVGSEAKRKSLVQRLETITTGGFLERHLLDRWFLLHLDPKNYAAARVFLGTRRIVIAFLKAALIKHDSDRRSYCSHDKENFTT
jgi:hypothetical protein